MEQQFLPPPHYVLDSKSIRYIKRCWLKLVLLLVPMLLVFGAVDVVHHHYGDLLKRASYLTLLQNLAYPWVKCTPGSYWYFSVTFQYYLLWVLAGKYLNKSKLALWSVILLVGLWILCIAGPSELLSVYRHSFTGWFFVFAFGVYMAKYHSSLFETVNTYWWQELIIIIIFSVFSVLMNMTIESWLFVPLVALVLFFALGLLVMRIKPLAMAFRWIGGLSASIFVCHAFIKGVIKDIGFRYTDNMWVLVVVYVLLTMFLAIAYEKLYRYLLAYFKVK